MARYSTMAILSAVFLLALDAPSSAVSGQQPGSTAPFTLDQAARGKAVYTTKCASCHGENLSGVDVAPALAGAGFLSNWNGHDLDELADRIRQTMPLDDPGSLNRSETVDILAFILESNGFSLSPEPLDTNPVAPRKYKIDALHLAH